MDYKFLLDLALIIFATKLLGIFTKKISMPQVVGALLAGVILGPSCLNVLHETDFINQVAELGVIVLMFTAGLEIDLKEMKRTGKAAFVIAVLGVLVPLATGFAVATIFNRGELAVEGSNLILQNIFIGIVLTATSVSITVETLRELGKLSSKAGNAILGAAIIDDILGIVALTTITSIAPGAETATTHTVGGYVTFLLNAKLGVNEIVANITGVIIGIVLFFAFCVLVGYFFYKIFARWESSYKQDMRRFVLIAFSFCLLMAYMAEEYFGVADITGAFISGIVLAQTNRAKYIMTRCETVSYLLLSPIFFASIGLAVVLDGMTWSLVIFTVVLTLGAILSKVVGCAIGAKICGYNNRQSLQIGTGMISRGEVALIVASKGGAALLNPLFFGPIIIMVVTTTIITPVLLRFVFKNKRDSVHKVEVKK